MFSRRHIIGLITIALLVGATVFWIWPPPEEYAQIEAFCWRLGAIMGVWWLAFPDLSRLPAWLLAGIPVLVIVLAKWPRYVVFVIPVMIVLAILKPRFGSKKR